MAHMLLDQPYAYTPTYPAKKNGTTVRRAQSELGRPLGYLIFSLMALIRDPIY